MRLVGLLELYRSLSIDFLEKRHQGLPNILVLFAFLRYSQPLSLRDVLAGLLSQLVMASENALSYMQPIYARETGKGADLSQDDMVVALKDIVQLLTKVFVAIDGLDEADDELKDGIVEVLPPLGFNILITSRPLPLYRQQTPNALHVAIQARTEDIALFVSAQVNRSARLKTILKGHPELTEQLSSRIKQKSNGM